MNTQAKINLQSLEYIDDYLWQVPSQHPSTRWPHIRESDHLVILGLDSVVCTLVQVG